MAGVHLLHIAVELSQGALPCQKIFLGAGHDQAHQGKTDQRGGNGGKAHAPFGDEHHHQTADKLRSGGDHGGQAVGKALHQGVYVVGHAAENIAVRDAAKELHGRPVHLVKNIRAQPV